MATTGYEPIVLPTGKVYGPVLYTCLRCGSAVHNQVLHNIWHRELASHNHATLSVIGGPALAGRDRISPANYPD